MHKVRALNDTTGCNNHYSLAVCGSVIYDVRRAGTVRCRSRLAGDDPASLKSTVASWLDMYKITC